MAASWGEFMAAQMEWAAMDECWRKGPWTAEEDRLLVDYVKHHGEGRWNSVSRLTGLRRNGKSCRLRWVNYLRPDLKRGHITPQEEKIILDLHTRWGNRWSTIARSLPGRTDNEIKNYWRTHFKKKTKTSTDNVEKLRARLLRKQQFQLQQLQLQQQEQQHEFSQFEMKNIASFLEENEYGATPSNSLPHPPTATTNTIMHQNAINSEEQDMLTLKTDTSNSEVSKDMQQKHQQQDMLWDEIWNTEELQGSFNAFCAPTKQANSSLHQFVLPYY